MDSIDIRLADLTGRARIRHAALHLFAAEGYAGTSLRAIAHGAGVSLALISHHFGSKHQLRDAIDAWVLATFEKAAREASARAGAAVDDTACRAFADTVGELLGSRAEIRAYLRRMAVVDATPNGAALMASLLALVRGIVERSQGVHDERELTRQSLHWLLLVLGPALLEPVLERCVPDLFDVRDGSRVQPEAQRQRASVAAPTPVANGRSAVLRVALV